MRSTARALRRVTGLCCRHAALTIGIGVALAVLGVLVARDRLTFETSELHLLPPGQAYVTRYREYSREFGELDELVIVVQGETLQDSKAYAAALVRALQAPPLAFNHLAYRVAPGDLDGRALLYLRRPSLERLRDRLLDHEGFLRSFAAAPGVGPLLDGLDHELAAGFVSHMFDLGLQDARDEDGLRFLRILLDQLRAALAGSRTASAPWARLIGEDLADHEDDGYFVSKDRRFLFILADPAGAAGGFTSDRAAVEEIRRRIARLRPQFPRVEAGVTGGPALSSDEMHVALADSTLATALAFGLTLGLLVLAFRRVCEPLLMLAVLALSLSWSIGVVALTVGHLTVFSVIFISIVIGLGIDYGIYVLARMDEEVTLGREAAEALEVTAARSGPGILLGAMTAAATFASLGLTDFHGVQELGVISGISLLLAFAGMLTVFPAALVLRARRRSASSPDPRARAVPIAWRRVRAIDVLSRRPGPVLAGAALLTGVSVWSARGVDFDYNLLHLHASGVESVTWEERIVAARTRSSFAALASATSLPELRRKRDAFARLDTVQDVDSALLLIPDDQESRLAIIADIGAVVRGVSVAPAPRPDVDRVRSALASIDRHIAIAAGEAGGGAAGEALAAIRGQIAAIQAALQAGERAAVEAALGDYQARLVAQFADVLATLTRNLPARPITPADLPIDLRRKFVSESGRLLLQIHPRVNIWERDGARRFVDELRSVDPDVTGTPIISYESMRRMELAYERGALYALALVACIAGLMLRRLRDTALALTPLVLGSLWAVGLMRLCGVELNIANVWGIPLIIGASAEYGLNVVARSIEAREHGGPAFPRSTMMAVALNGLTTVAGFGSLLLAHHRGIRSLGLLLTVGSATSLIAALAVLPVLIQLTEHWSRGRARRRRARAPMSGRRTHAS